MNDVMETSRPSRRQIAIRLLYTLACVILFEIVKILIQVTVLFQFIFLLFTQRYSGPLRNFSNQVSTYAYKLIRYMTLNDNHRPFPFHDFPSEMERPEDPVRFDQTP
jgi:hypothetical protein